MKTLAEPQTGWVTALSSSSSRPMPRSQFRGCCDHARLARRPHDFVNRRPSAADDRLPRRRTTACDREHTAERLGNEDGVAADTVANQLVELAAVAPGGFMQVVSGEQDGAGCQRLPSRGEQSAASTAAARPPFMSEAPLPLSRPPSTTGGTNGKWTVSRCPSN